MTNMKMKKKKYTCLGYSNRKNQKYQPRNIGKNQSALKTVTPLVAKQFKTMENSMIKREPKIIQNLNKTKNHES